MVFKTVPDDSKSHTIQIQTGPKEPIEPPITPVRKSWPQRLREWLEGLTGASLPKSPFE